MAAASAYRQRGGFRGCIERILHVRRLAESTDADSLEVGMNKPENSDWRSAKASSRFNVGELDRDVIRVPLALTRIE